ncbi:MAG: glycine C-acetyltransferase [Bacteroidales bacterium]|jgi:glycine C-acetyltransferase|nr:glycine C-acetyltransferase [Bacteroidales bacterium]HOA08661.1 glycine C-acetyltransferase [Tenuifilaceae bacterium]MBP8644175.1 glycine C-acetyltransferase [Bacteroidales bacterium]NLI86842.1 glycine C-acetyltransferase [Bacteroidales bacterium]HOC35503.1 glycine C-acetyltransferase [Tenuifilaceae bacterium]
MYGKIQKDLQKQLEAIVNDGLYKTERAISTPQGAEIKANGKKVLNFCANNYLGLSSHPAVLEAGKKAIDEWGFGMSSVRFICGTLELHKQLEAKLTDFLGTEDTILYSSAFDANGGVFEPILGEEDAIISDELNHASIIDGVRLCKAQRFRYKNNDMDDLERVLKEASGCRYKMIVTDGVFSMDGIIAQVDKICDLADKHDALVMVDDSHATGFVGKTGRGTSEYCNVMGRVDVISTTFGKALGGASGGCISGRKEIVDMLRQRSRPYLFSNSLMPAIAGSTLMVLNMLSKSTELRDKLWENTALFRKGMTDAGFRIVPGVHPITPILLGHLPNDAKLSQDFADMLFDEGIYVTGFFYPVVPKGKARIRVQLSAAHSRENVLFAIDKFTKIGKKLGVI